MVGGAEAEFKLNWPTKKYRVIYADPPWHYDNGGPQGGVDHQYPTLDIESIKALPVKEIADDPSLLFLWATFPQLSEALGVIKTWGFVYRTLAFSWIKLNKNDGQPFFGVGYYTKSNAEVCLLGIKGHGRSLIKSNAVSSCILAPRGQHSAKPREARERIEQLTGDVPRIELFARETYPGWDTWGNETDKFNRPLFQPENK